MKSETKRKTRATPSVNTCSRSKRPRVTTIGSHNSEHTAIWNDTMEAAKVISARNASPAKVTRLSPTLYQEVECAQRLTDVQHQLKLPMEAYSAPVVVPTPTTDTSHPPMTPIPQQLSPWDSQQRHPVYAKETAVAWKALAVVSLSIAFILTLVSVPLSMSVSVPIPNIRTLLRPTFGTTLSESIIWFFPRATGNQERTYPHIIPPPRPYSKLSGLTLRQFLLHGGVHLGLAPSFFGFYGYFGMLAAWEQSNLLSQLQGVAGASAGAMSAVLLAAGISPLMAAKYCETMSLTSFADPPGLLAFFRGDLFEQLMDDFIQNEKPGHSGQLQDGVVPVAVSGFDLKTLSNKILSQGSMAKAARASASFPILFQPTQWKDEDGTTSFLMDGGVMDGMGVEGLAVMEGTAKRVVNMVVGHFGGRGAGGPSEMPEGVMASEVVSVSIQNLPRCGPWAMENGPRAVEAAQLAMLASLDVPLYFGKEMGHYELYIDATEFIIDLPNPGLDSESLPLSAIVVRGTELENNSHGDNFL